MINQALSLGKILSLSLVLSLLTLLGVLVVNPQDAKAAYDGGRIIDSPLFLDSKSMSMNEVQSFLSSKGGQIASRSFLLNCDAAGSQAKQAYLSLGAPCGQSIPASHIIYYSSQVYGISPKVVIATLQKEQSLITAVNPTDRQYSQAMGYACPTSGSCSDSSNFFWQIDNGTWVLRFHYERARGNMSWWHTSTSWVCGSEKNYYKPNLYPGQNVNFYDENGVMYRTHYIENAATSSLYCYTPHAYNNPQGLYGRAPYGTTGLYYSGSYNFVYFYEAWFGTTRYSSNAYSWSLVSQHAYNDPGRTVKQTSVITAQPGNKVYLTLKAKNTGYKTWSKNNLRLGTLNDRQSMFYDPSWPNAVRASMLKEDTVLPGEVGTFDFTFSAPTGQGSYKEHFNLVADGESWLLDIGLNFIVNVVTPDPAPAAAVSLTTGQELKPGEYLLSPHKQSVLVLQGDGNLVYYENFAPVWSSGTAGKAPKKLIMQGDGNLVLYDTNNAAVWSSGTNTGTSNYLTIQTDGNAVIYGSNQALWNIGSVHIPSQTNYVNTFVNSGGIYPGQLLQTPDRRFKLIFQYDGNLVLYSPNRALWSSGTAGKPAVITRIQGDGNIVIYDINGRPVWNSGTDRNPNSTLFLQQDGNLVLYNAQNRAVWSSGTAGQQ